MKKGQISKMISRDSSTGTLNMGVRLRDNRADFCTTEQFKQTFSRDTPKLPSFPLGLEPSLASLVPLYGFLDRQRVFFERLSSGRTNTGTSTDNLRASQTSRNVVP